MLKRLYPLQKDLGKGRSRNLIVSSALFSILIFFYSLNVVSLLQPTVYPFIGRISFVTSFVDNYFTDYFFDSLIILISTVLWLQFAVTSNKKYYLITSFIISFLLFHYLNMDFATKIITSVSLPAILILLIWYKISNKENIPFSLKLSVNYVAILGILIAIVSASVIVSYILYPDLPLPSENYLYYFFMIFSILSPLYLVLIAFNYPLRLLYGKLKNRWWKSALMKEENNTVKEKHLKLRMKVFQLLVIIILSIVISMIPHLSTVNPDNFVIGSDTKYYLSFLNTMADSSGYYEIIHKAFVTIVTGDRPFSLLFFFWMSTIFYQGNFYYLLEDLPLLLGPLLVTSIYFLTLSITKSHHTSILASLLTIPSHILIGIYAGFYANWFSLIWGFLALLFLFRSIDRPEKINFFIFSALLITMMFSHVQTWTIFMYVIGLFVVIFFLKNIRENKKLSLYISISILPSVLADLSRLFLLNSSGVKQELSFAAEREVGIHGISTIWNNLIDTTHLYVAGQIANPIILLLVIYWLYSAKIKIHYTIFLIIFFSLFALPLLLADGTIQSRFFYEIPFQIPAAIALIALRQRMGIYLPFAICLCLIVMSVYMATNFVLVIPEQYL